MNLTGSLGRAVCINKFPFRFQEAMKVCNRCGAVISILSRSSELYMLQKRQEVENFYLGPMET